MSTEAQYIKTERLENQIKLKLQRAWDKYTNGAHGHIPNVSFTAGFYEGLKVMK